MKRYQKIDTLLSSILGSAIFTMALKEHGLPISPKTNLMFGIANILRVICCNFKLRFSIKINKIIKSVIQKVFQTYHTGSSSISLYLLFYLSTFIVVAIN